MEYQVVDDLLAPKEVQDWIHQNKYYAAHIILHTDGKIYTVLTRGEKKTGGYGIEVIDVEEQDEVIFVKAKYLNPAPDQMVIQVISYPVVIIELQKTEKEIIIDVQL